MGADIDAEAVFDGDEVLVILAEHGPEQMRLVEVEIQTGAVPRFGLCLLFRHLYPCLSSSPRGRGSR
jgi:hypothetical protein